MPKNFDALLGKYQSNCYPAMYDFLAAQLGVSADSLRRLGIGYAPIVEFKKGKNFQGWWAIGELDEQAQAAGISLRANDGTKVMLPGSSHGFVYEVNPHHEGGARAYDPGPHNWVRTKEAGVSCPLCGKPDGCLLTADNPADPTAVICIRRDSAVPMKLGHLHVLKQADRLTGINPLMDNGGPLLVVEGMTDTAAALDLGYDAIGRPSNLALLDMLADLVRGRDIIVIGENDQKPDGRKPGEEGMIAAFQACRRSSKNVQMVMPPPHVKDLRAWVVKYKLTRPEFESYLSKHGQRHHEATTLPNAFPLTVARAWLHARHRASGRTLLRNYRGQWHRFENGRYRLVEENGLRQDLYNWADGKLALNEKEIPKPLTTGPTLITSALDAALADAYVDAPELPAWINKGSGPRPEDLVVFSNGMLNTSAFVRGDESLLDLTPDYFTRFAAPYPFDPTATAPLWLNFLGQVFDDDEQKIRLLQEWFGYNLVPDTSMHKMLLMVGPPRSGKSTILEILRNVVGPHQCAATTFRQLTSQFGMAPLIGCLSAIMGDAHLSKSADGTAALEVLKQVVAGDPQGVDIKYQEGSPSIRLKVRFSIAVNELPALPDFSGAMVPRLNILDFKNSFVGREDFQLGEKLAAETAGIAMWALQGLAALRMQGRFTVPESSLTILGEWSTLTNPISGFVEEACDRTDRDIRKDELFDAWEKWRQERRIAPMTRSLFYERMKASAPFVVSDTVEFAGTKHSIFRNITLKAWARKKLLGAP